MAGYSLSVSDPASRPAATGSGNLVALAMQAGFNAEEARVMAAIIMAESGGRPTAHNPNAATGDNSYGLAQINMIGKLGPARRAQFGISSNEQLFDPLTNLRAAYRVYLDAGRKFTPWTTYTKGLHNKWMGSASSLSIGGNGSFGGVAGGGGGGSGGVAGGAGYYAGSSEAAEIAYAREQAKKMFPWMAPFLDKDPSLTPRGYFAPYIQTAAKILEIPPETIQFADPKWRKILEVQEGDTRRQAALWEMESLLKQNPEYGYDKTLGARTEANQLATTIARTFGRIG